MGEFAKRADELMGDTPEWRMLLEDQQKRLSEHVPTSKEEAEMKALANIKALKEKAYALGYRMRANKRKEEEPLLRDVGGGMPGREVVVDLPAVKQGWYEPKLRSKHATHHKEALELHPRVVDALIGATLGGGAGAVTGAVSAGEGERLGGGLRGALAGTGAGALTGAAALPVTERIAKMPEGIGKLLAEGTAEGVIGGAAPMAGWVVGPKGKKKEPREARGLNPDVWDDFDKAEQLMDEEERTGEKLSSLRKRSGVFGEMLSPIGATVEGALAGTAQMIADKTREGRRTTSDPKTLITYYPRMAIAGPKAFHEGYTQAEEDADVLRAEEMEQAIVKAREEYEKALSEEYAAKHVAKTAGELIDGLAQHHVKSAQGEINQALGMYLALASILGYGAHTASSKWVKSRDPRQQKFKAVKEELRKKRMRQPAPVLVDVPEPVDAEANLRM